MLGNAHECGFLPHPFAVHFHPALLVNDRIMQNAWKLHAVGASGVCVEDDVALREELVCQRRPIRLSDGA